MNAPDEIASLQMRMGCWMPFKAPSCVYFLCLRGEVVYVGQSVNFLGRMAGHLSDKEFDSVWFLPVTPYELDETEIYFISRLKPKLNKQRYRVNPGISTSSIKLQKKYPEFFGQIVGETVGAKP